MTPEQYTSLQRTRPDLDLPNISILDDTSCAFVNGATLKEVVTQRSLEILADLSTNDTESKFYWDVPF